MALSRRKAASLALGAAIFFAILFAWQNLDYVHFRPTSGFATGKGSQAQAPGLETPATAETDTPDTSPSKPDNYLWRTIEYHYPISSFLPIPTDCPQPLPKVQADFPAEDDGALEIRITRLQEIRDSFAKCWDAYTKLAWMKDEVTPISGKGRDPFGGWGATLVDSLDTLWIMDLKGEFAAGVEATEQIDFTTTTLEQVNVFETTIRYLGGFLSAYDLSGDERLLRRAVDVGDMLMKAFDTPNHLPITRWDFRGASSGARQRSNEWMPIAEVATLSMEFTRLSIVTGDAKYFTAVQPIAEMMEKVQMSTKLPGMWSVSTNGAKGDFDWSNDYTLGGMADSAYEYLIKMVALLGDQLPVYKTMYIRAMETVQQYILYRPLTKDSDDILIAGKAFGKEKKSQKPRMLTSTGHLTCFAGGMFALGGRLLSNETHLSVGSKLTEGCIWAYASMPHGIMPETFDLVRCRTGTCGWNESAWHTSILKNHEDNLKDHPATADSVIKDKRLPLGFTGINDSRYILRPEAIESIFVLYRTTGDVSLLEKAWDMWGAIRTLTETDLAFSAVDSVEHDEPRKTDSMESFWMSETLKYFYLIFSEPDLVSLDEFVFNTEAHPFRRLVV